MTFDPAKWNLKPFNPPVADRAHFIYYYRTDVVDDESKIIPVMRMDEVFLMIHDVELLVLRENEPPLWRPIDTGIYDTIQSRELERLPLTDPQALENLCETLRARSTDLVKYSLFTCGENVLIVREEVEVEEPIEEDVPAPEPAPEALTGLQLCVSRNCHRPGNMVFIAEGSAQGRETSIRYNKCLDCGGLVVF